MILAQIALIIFYILIFLLVIILLILLIPFSYSVFLNIYNTDINGIISVKWLSGLLGARIVLEEKCYQIIFLGKQFSKISIKDNMKSAKSIKDEKTKQKKKKKYKRKIHVKDISLNELYDIFKEFIKRIFKSIEPEYFKIKGVYGFDDPSTTGITYGVISILNSFKYFKVDVFPVFTEEIIDAEIEVYGNIRFINLIIIFISTLIKKPVRKLVFRKKDKTKIKSALT